MSNNDLSGRDKQGSKLFSVTEGRRPLPMTPLSAENTATSAQQSGESTPGEDRGRRPIPMTPPETTPGGAPAKPPASPSPNDKD